MLGGGGEQDDDHRHNDVSLARVSRDGRDCNLLAINGCNREERHRCIDPISSDAKEFGMVVIGTMPPYDNCPHRDNNDNHDDDDGLARYLALVALLSILLCVGMCRHFHGGGGPGWQSR